MALRVREADRVLTRLRDLAAASSKPARLALQSGQLDDHRRAITRDHDLWDDAYRCFLQRGTALGPSEENMRALCARWPSGKRTSMLEAVAVVVALASSYASRPRILQALGANVTQMCAEFEAGRVLVCRGVVPRPRFPHIYDPDSEERAPINALLDGPRSPRVAELLETLKRQDETLADAIVLGADLNTLESLHRLSHQAREAGRTAFAVKVEQDQQRWKRRADQARARQRLESAQFGWHSDNFPPECIEAAQAELRHDIEVMLENRRSVRPA